MTDPVGANPEVIPGVAPLALTTSATYQFDPSIGELALYAFNMAGVRPPALTQTHMETARMAANMVNARWSAMGVNLWTVDLQTITLIPGQATYSVPSDTVGVLDAYRTRGTGAAARDNIILPVSRTEYAGYSNKAQKGKVTVFWYNQLLAPQITFYMTPDGTDKTVSYYRIRQIQDAKLAGANPPEMPYYFLEAYAYALAQRLALIWNPGLADGLKVLADESYEIAANRNTEQAAFYISPMTQSYFRT